MRVFVLACVTSVLALPAAVQYIHSKTVVHLDIKPENIMICKEGGVPRALLVDFGLATVFPNPMKVPFTVLRGSKPFESPEVRTSSTADTVYFLRMTCAKCLRLTDWCSRKFGTQATLAPRPSRARHAS